RRPAAAGRDRPRARLAADGHVRRRADRQPRLQHEWRDPRVAARVGLQLRPDDGDGDARRTRGRDRRSHPLPRRRADRQGARPVIRSRRDRGDGGGERTMNAVALKGLLGRKFRAALTAFAIVLGVAMISGAFVLTDTFGKSLDHIYKQSYAASDAVISSEEAVNTGATTPEAPAFSAEVLRKVESLPGVRTAQASIEDQARLVDASGNAIGTADNGTAVGVDPSADQSLNPLHLVAGEWPRGDQEIAIDKTTAKKHHFQLGQTVGAFADGPVHRYRVSGIVRFGSVDSIGSATIAVFDLATAQRLFDKQGQLDLIRVQAKEGVSDAELVRQIRPLLSVTTQVKTAAAQASSDSKDTQAGVKGVRVILTG